MQQPGPRRKCAWRAVADSPTCFSHISKPKPSIALETQWLSRPPHPWRRYFARTLDTTVNGAIVWFIGAIIVSVLFPKDAPLYLALTKGQLSAALLTILLAIPLNALLIGLTGGTLGKWFFGVKVCGVDGQTPGLYAALRRELLVWIKGMAFGIPLVCLFTFGSAYSMLKRTGTTSWDSQLGTEVRYRPSCFRQIAGVACGLLVWTSVISALATLGRQHSRQLASLPHATVQLVSDDQVKVEGPFGAGTARELRRVLDVSPDVQFVQLESSTGGLVDEGLGIYDLLRARHLSTFTQTACVSACTIAYMGGERRFLGQNASLQFHEWERDGVRVERDSEMGRRLLVASGVSTEFAARAFSGHELWAPDRATLVAAGVVTHSMDGKPYH